MAKQLMSNVVKKEQLREVQSNTLSDLADNVTATFGPQGSNTMMIRDNAFTEYSKDGFKTLSNIQYNDSIERSIKDELQELTRYIVKTVGDGTTSAVVLSNLIFQQLLNTESKLNRSPYEIIQDFKTCVEDIKKAIKSHGRDITLDDIYKIAYISTNGNNKIAANLQEIYKQYGFSVFIDVAISNTTDNILKSYDGLTLNTGFCDPAFVNQKNKAICSIRNPRVYNFIDPIDTPEMMAFLNQIIMQNIIEPFKDDRSKIVPTVILAPKISRDMSSLITDLISFLYQIGTQDISSKPPILIISDIYQVDEYSDITRLCGCKNIKKYIDPKIQEEDVLAGRAPNLETVCEFYGSVDLVEADADKTKFINPKNMFDTDENGERVYSKVYQSQLDFLEAELKRAIETGEDASVTGKLKRRLNSLKSNMVDFLIGGVTVTDRDSLRDLVEDAVLNCRSACKNGVGYGANFEGLRASVELMSSCTDNKTKEMYEIILNAYTGLSNILYKTVMSEDAASTAVTHSLNVGMPYNIKTASYDGNVLCSIDTDIVILDTISKIITVMFTANQALVQTPMHNKYIKVD